MSMTPDEMVKLYVKTANSPTNGWNQCIVEAPGEIFDGKQSHYLMKALRNKIGDAETTKLLNLEFENADG